MASSTLPELPVCETGLPIVESLDHRTVRVLHVINGEHYAGAERVQDLLAAELGKHGFQVAFACLKPGQFPRVRHFREARLYELPMRRSFDVRPAWKVAKIVRRENFELIHCHTARSALIGGLASRLTGVPLIHHVHSPTSRDSEHRWRGKFNAIVERMSLRRASALVAVSGSLGAHIRERGFSDETITVVPNGVPCRRPVGPRSASKLDWTFGTVALFRPRKGLEVLLRAIAMLKSQGLPVGLHAVGRFETSQYQQQIVRLTEELDLVDSVHWAGFTEDIDAELAKMDVFVLPSLFGEGLPMVILEAMAAGVPVVATDVEGIPEAIRDGRDGLIVRPDDSGSLASALERLIRGEVDAVAMRASALSRQAERFSESSMAAGVAEVYRRVLAAR